MKDPYAPRKTMPPEAAVWLAAGAVLLLIITNLGWVLAYSALSQKVYQLQNSSPSPSATAQPSPSPSASPAKGTIKGSVGYPAGTAPAQSVCAVSVADDTQKFCVDHPAGNNLGYSLPVPEGTYYVYASLKQAQGSFTTSYKAYYDKYVKCSQTPGAGTCTSDAHTSYVQVAVAAGGTATNINPTDWYAQNPGQ